MSGSKSSNEPPAVNAPSKDVRFIEAAAARGGWCWQEKAIRRRIREAFDSEKTVPSALAVYDALTEIASDCGAEIFQTTHAHIAVLSGWSVRTVADRCQELAEEGFIKVHTPAVRGPCTYTMVSSTLSVKQPLQNELHLSPIVLQPKKTAPLQRSKENKEPSEERGRNCPPRMEVQKLYPRELSGLIKEQKAFLKELALGDPRREAIAHTLAKYETALHGAPRTRAEKLHATNPLSVPSTIIPLNKIRLKPGEISKAFEAGLNHEATAHRTASKARNA